jgi:Lamin Tail Domain
MKSTHFVRILSLFFLGFVGCTPDRTFEAPQAQPPIGGANNIQIGTLRINEFMASGSTYSNELVLGSDWIELFNTTSDTIRMTGGEWFITDTLGWQTKWVLPDTSILPRGYLVIWADGQDTTLTQMHSNFKLSASGEEIGIYYQPTGGHLIPVDSLQFLGQTSGMSQERFPDGTFNWIFTLHSTLGGSNEP